MVTQEEYNVSKQKTRKLYAKIKLLNYNFQTVDELQGVVLGAPSFTNDRTSDLRRSCSISIYPKDKSFDIKYGNKIWLDKYVQIYLGIENIHTKEIIYTNMGIYIIDNPDQTYSATDNTISIQGLDLMAKLTGERNGNLEGLPHIVEANANVRNAIISTIELGGFTRYVVEECPIDVPNEIEIDVGGTVYDILTQLRDVLPNYQMYFDVDGVFHYEAIPSGENEQIMVTDDLWKDTLISYQKNTDLQSIKNIVEVFGKTHDIDSSFGEATVSDVTISGEQYSLISVSIADALLLYDGLKIGFTIDKSTTHNVMFKLNDFNSVRMVDEYGNNIEINDTSAVYIARWIYTGEEDIEIEDGQTPEGYWQFMGEITPYGIAKDENPESPYYINGTMGEVRIVLTGGEYDNIYTSNLAEERARWELYKRCNMQDTVTLTTIPIYWLDVNWLVEITLPNKQGEEETVQYIINSVDTTYGTTATQTVNMMRYYPYYPVI